MGADKNRLTALDAALEVYRHSPSTTKDIDDLLRWARRIEEYLGSTPAALAPNTSPMGSFPPGAQIGGYRA